MVGNRSPALRRASRLGGEGPPDRRAARADDLLRRVPLAQAQRGILRPRRHPPRGRGLYPRVFRTWARDWGCGYFKTDFMHLGSIYGPETARWHRAGPVADRDLDADGAADPRGDRRRALARLRRAALGAGRAGRRDADRPRHRRVLEGALFGRVAAARPDRAQLRQRHPVAGRSRLHPAARPLPRADRRAGALAGVVRRAGGRRADDERPPRRGARRRGASCFTALAGDGAAFACDFPLLGQARADARRGHRTDGQADDGLARAIRCWCSGSVAPTVGARQCLQHRRPRRRPADPLGAGGLRASRGR